MTESRWHPRKYVTSPVAFEVGAGPRVEAMFRDISLGGMYIETDEPPAYGTELRVYLTLPALSKEAIITAVVRWAKPNGMGVQFGAMGALETHALTELLAGER